MTSDGQTARFKLDLSDGVSTSTAVVASQVAGVIANQGIKEFTVIRITNFRCNVMKDIRMMILNDFEKVQDLDYIIGNVSLDQKPPPQQNAPYYNQQSNAPSYGQQTSNAPYNQAPTPYGAQQGNTSYGGQQGQQGQQGHNAPYGQQANAPYGQQANAPYGGQQANAPYGQTSYGGMANTRPVVRDDSVSQAVVPISSINPYSNKWTIKARVTSKSAMKTWSNAKGEGTLFSIDLLDSAGTEIRATFFKDACQKFFPEIEEGRVYTFSSGSLKVVANSNYSRIKNPYELTFDVKSDIRPSMDEGIRAQTYEFSKIGALQSLESGAIVDVIGIVKSVGDVAEIISQKMGGKVLHKRDIVIMDETLHDISVTLWGEKATAEDQFSNNIVAFKSVKLGEFNGRSLGTINTTSIKTNPDIPEGHFLSMWRAQNADNMNHSVSLSSGGGGGGGSGLADPLEKRKTIVSIKNDQLGMNDKPDFVTVRASIGFVKKETDPWYPACPNVPDGKTNPCNKKMIQNNSSWVCERCGISRPSPEFRYILSCTVMDHSAMCWVTLFNEQAEKLLSIKANDLHDIKDQGQEDEFNRIMAIPKFQEYNLKLRVKFEAGGNNDGEAVQRQKIVVQQLYELDYVSESKQLIDAITRYD